MRRTRRRARLDAVVVLAAALGMGAVACEDEAEESIAEDQMKMAQQVEEEGRPVVDTELVTFTVAQWEVDRDLNYVPDVLDEELRRAPAGAAAAVPAARDCFVAQCGEAAQQAGLRQWPRQVNTMVLLDASGSMAGKVGGQAKIDVARDAVRKYLEAVPEEEVFRTGLIAFGHKGENTPEAKAESCDAIETIVPLGQGGDPKAVAEALGRFEPSGWTPIDQALREAAQRLPAEAYAANRVVLISDGIESCGGDSLATVREFVDEGVFGRVDVIGFKGDADVDLSGLKEIAASTAGGRYFEASTADDFGSAFEELRTETQKIATAWRCGIEEQEALSACYTDYGKRVSAMVEGPERSVKVVGEAGEELSKETAKKIATAVDQVVADLKSQARTYGDAAEEAPATP